MPRLAYVMLLYCTPILFLLGFMKFCRLKIKNGLMASALSYAISSLDNLCVGLIWHVLLKGLYIALKLLLY